MVSSHLGNKTRLTDQTISRCRSETFWHIVSLYGRAVIIWSNSNDIGSPTTARNCANKDWTECDGTASTTCIIFHFTLNGDYIFNPLTGFTTHTVSFCKPYSSRAERIRLPTINGFENRWRRFWDCPSYTRSSAICSKSNSLKATRL